MIHSDSSVKFTGSATVFRSFFRNIRSAGDFWDPNFVFSVQHHKADLSKHPEWWCYWLRWWVEPEKVGLFGPMLCNIKRNKYNLIQGRTILGCKLQDQNQELTWAHLVPGPRSNLPKAGKMLRWAFETLATFRRNSLPKVLPNLTSVHWQSFVPFGSIWYCFDVLSPNVGDGIATSCQPKQADPQKAKALDVWIFAGRPKSPASFQSWKFGRSGSTNL